MSQCIFSVIIPAYNCEETITNCLESITSQKHNDYEIILINDCSTDNTLNIIQEYIKSHINYPISLIINDKNRGPAESRNEAIKAAKGEYICFLDSDDYFSDKYFETLEKIITIKNPDLIYIGYNHIFNNVTKIIFDKFLINKDYFIANSSGALWRFIVKREIISRYPLPSIRNAEDIAIIPLIIEDSDVIEFCPIPLYNYVHNKSSLSSTHTRIVTENFIKSFDYTKNYSRNKQSSSLEFHGVKTILYGGILNGIKAGMSNVEIRQIIRTYQLNYPHWNKNEYIKFYSKPKKLFLWLIYHDQIRALRLYTKMHSILLNLI